MRKLKLFAKKLRLRMAYRKYVALEERYSATCGRHLLDELVPELPRMREEMHNLLKKCKELEEVR